jgi:hypothetical protein
MLCSEPTIYHINHTITDEVQICCVKRHRNTGGRLTLDGKLYKEEHFLADIIYSLKTNITKYLAPSVGVFLLFI